MTIQECYEKLGGDYAQLKTRLPSDKLIVRFITKFPDDASFADLSRGMQEGQREKAFRAAHTLKGVCGNLSLDKLFASVSQLTEVLRPQTDTIPQEAHDLMKTVVQDYTMTVNTIRDFLASME